jgi:hypothetical protein
VVSGNAQPVQNSYRLKIQIKTIWELLLSKSCVWVCAIKFLKIIFMNAGFEKYASPKQDISTLITKKVIRSFLKHFWDFCGILKFINSYESWTRPSGFVLSSYTKIMTNVLLYTMWYPDPEPFGKWGHFGHFACLCDFSAFINCYWYLLVINCGVLFY